MAVKNLKETLKNELLPVLIAKANTILIEKVEETLEIKNHILFGKFNNTKSPEEFLKMVEKLNEKDAAVLDQQAIDKMIKDIENDLKSEELEGEERETGLNLHRSLLYTQELMLMTQCHLDDLLKFTKLIAYNL